MSVGWWVIALTMAVVVASALPLAPTHGAPIVAKKKCHYVTKKVHGHKKKVRVCTKVKPAASTPTLTATATNTATATVTPTVTLSPTVTTTAAPTATPTATTTPVAFVASHDVSVNLFEWSWPSVAGECTNILGPAGYGSVQVAPPEDSLAVGGHQWWDVYQPADYNLTSRMGNEAQFQTMVATCRRAGVKVYVDAVINHVAGGNGRSYGGYSYSKYNHPGLYSSADFHHYPADCPEPDGTIHDFNNYTEVTHCELLGLADLGTESTYVRSTLAGYLNKLIDYGVSGFRIDAAKHIGQTDLAAIESQLHKTVDGEAPYIALEVSLGSTGQLAPDAFEGQGSLLGFDYADVLKFRFSSTIANLKTFGSGLLPSDKELVFVENHDTERDGSTLSYKDGATNTLATEFMLAWGYGTPQVYASFNWNSRDDPPPSDSNGCVLPTTCGAGWTCTDRDQGVVGMVGWHNDVTGASVSNWYDDGSNLIAFSRGTKGWIAINNETAPQTRAFTTGLPAGTYCDIIHGKPGGGCSGHTVTVDGQGVATVTVSARDSVAIDTADVP
jgi:alpha-amylase